MYRKAIALKQISINSYGESALIKDNYTRRFPVISPIPGFKEETGFGSSLNEFYNNRYDKNFLKKIKCFVSGPNNFQIRQYRYANIESRLIKIIKELQVSMRNIQESKKETDPLRQILKELERAIYR